MVLEIDFEKAFRIGWDFLDVMKGKGFPDRWISWVMKTVREGRMCINVNGVVRFNLVADALEVMLHSSISKGHIKGVLTDLIPGGVSHIICWDTDRVQLYSTCYCNICNTSISAIH